jgi:hypothetical protein
MPKIEVNHLLRVLCGCSNGKGTSPGEAGHHRPAPCPGGPALRLEQNFSGIKLRFHSRAAELI